MRTFTDERGPPTRVDRTHLTALVKRNPMPEVENVYNRVERALPEKSLLVIDSLEGVTHKYGLEMEEFVMALQKDLVEGSNTNVVMILEKPEAGGIEYLVDGLISIQREELDERRVRHLRLEKLRATNDRPAALRGDPQRRPVRGARRRRPETTSPRRPVWRPVTDPERFYSTGIPDFDHLLGGGFRRGSFNAFEIDVNVGIDDYYMLFTPTFLNFLTQSPRDDRGPRRRASPTRSSATPSSGTPRRTSSTPGCGSSTTPRTRPRSPTSSRWPTTAGTRRCGRWSPPRRPPAGPQQQAVPRVHARSTRWRA